MNSRGFRGFEVSSTINDVEIDEVWNRIETWDGVNFELGPLIRMSAPADYPRVSDIPPDGIVHFTSYILLFGFLPIDAHRFGLVAVEAPYLFDERSSNNMMRVWTHRRHLETVPDGVKVTDHCTVQARWFMPGALMTWIYRQIFKRRHRRLVRYFQRRVPSSDHA